MRIVISIIFLSMTLNGFSQGDPQITMFWNNYTLFNPAATGLFYKHQANVSYRHLNSYGQTLCANYDAKVNLFHGGLGVNYVHDRFGSQYGNKVNLNYSYHIQLGEKSVLAAGISAGVSHVSRSYRFDNGLLENKRTQDQAFSMNFGIVFKRDRLNIGLSSTQINQPRYPIVGFSQNRSFNFVADYMFQLPFEIELKPQILWRYESGYNNLNFNLLAYYKSSFGLEPQLETTIY